MSALTTEPPGTATAGHPYRWRILAVVLAAEILDLLDATVVNIAAPSIRADLGGAASTMQWIAVGYTLAFGVLLVVGGRLGDRWGRRTSFAIGAAGFTLASVLCAVAVNPQMLIASRVLQGALGALLLPQQLGILKSVFPADQLGTAYSAFGPVMGLSAVGGPILAGALIDLDAFGSGWRLIFLINVPIGVVAVVGALLWMPRGTRDPATHIDAGSGSLLAGALVLIIYPLIQGPENGWAPWTFVSLVAGVLTGLLFVRRELRAEAPLIETTLLRNAVFGSGMLLVVVFFAGLSGLMLTVSLFVQGALRVTPLTAGLTLAPMALGMVVGSVAAFPLIARLGRRLIMFGLAGNALGAGLLALFVHLRGADATALTLVGPLFVIGLGMAGVVAPMFDVIVAGVSDREANSASGVLTAVQQISGAIGVALVTTLFLALTRTRPAFEAMAISSGLVGLFVLAGVSLVFLLPEQAKDGGH
jgi:EmrB/QacA subfamily drug resistance transporter